MNVATTAERMIAIRDNLLTAIEAVTAAGATKPTYSNGVRSVSWTEHLRALFEQLESVEARIARSQPVEIITRVTPVH